jgi:hypothetical protein
MRANIPHDVAALLEQLDRRIEESRALRVELQQKTDKRHTAEQPADETVLKTHLKS